MIGGASGVGKTLVSYPLARQFGVGITEVDDFYGVLERMTTPEQQLATVDLRRTGAQSGPAGSGVGGSRQLLFVGVELPLG